MFSLLAAIGSSRSLSRLNQMKRSPLLWGGLILLLILALPFLLVIVAIMGIDISKEPWSLAEQLPDSVVVLEEIADQTGMDSFFLVKARFTSEDEITAICSEYNLLPNQDDVSPLSFSRLYDERHDVAWFPLLNVTRRYAFTTQDRDGRQKDGFETLGYEAVIWIDDDKMEFVIQLAAL